MLVKYVHPFGYFDTVRCDADAVAIAHMEYFRAREWSVDVVACTRPGRSLAAFRERFPWVKSCTTIDVPPAADTLHDQLFAFEEAASSRAVQAVLSRPADLYMSNGVFTAPLIRLLPSNCRRVLEAISLFCDRVARSTLLDELQREYLLQVELDLFTLFDAAILKSREEHATVVRARATGVHHVPWFASEQSPSGAADPVHDILFVGDASRPNVEGLNWFYRTVFVPHLWSRGIKLGIAGSVGDSVEFADLNVTRIRTVGGALDPIYAAAKLVVAPIFEGTGIARETVDALIKGKALVATPRAVRGLDPSSSAMVVMDMAADPGRVAETIIGLLNNPERRRSLEQNAKEYSRVHFGRDVFFAEMDRVMNAIGLERPRVMARAG